MTSLSTPQSRTTALAHPRLFSHTLRVYIEDTDAVGIVYHSNHIKYMERARTEALRECGLTKGSLTDEHGVYFVVKDIFIDYKLPALMDDLLEVRTFVDSISGARLYFIQEIYRSETLIASAKLTLVCVNTSHRPTNLPASIGEAFQRPGSTPQTDL